LYQASCRIGAHSVPESRFGFDSTGGGPKHVTEIERRRCVSRIAFHEEAIELLGFGYIPRDRAGGAQNIVCHATAFAASS
jgi:hypothetical protein